MTQNKTNKKPIYLHPCLTEYYHRGTQSTSLNLNWIICDPYSLIVCCISGSYSIFFVLWVGMATHSSILAWRIPWTQEPGGLQLTGSQRRDWAQHAHVHQKMSRETTKNNHILSTYLKQMKPGPRFQGIYL